MKTAQITFDTITVPQREALGVARHITEWYSLSCKHYDDQIEAAAKKAGGRPALRGFGALITYQSGKTRYIR